MQNRKNRFYNDQGSIAVTYNEYKDVEIGQSLISTANSKNSQTITAGN